MRPQFPLDFTWPGVRRSVDRQSLGEGDVRAPAWSLPALLALALVGCGRNHPADAPTSTVAVAADSAPAERPQDYAPRDRSVKKNWQVGDAAASGRTAEMQASKSR